MHLPTLLCSLLFVLSVPLRGDASDGEWRKTRTDEGISSYERRRADAPLPLFRAQTELEASIWEAVAILDDVDRACEWTSYCEQMRTVKRISASELLVYARMDAPWPVRDRDVVVRVQVVYGERGELTLAIAADAAEPPAPSAGVVRMPRFLARYTFRSRPHGKTWVEYEIEFDPGGTLPDWLKRLVARDLAHNTLSDLRDRIVWARERGLYRERARELARRAEDATGSRWSALP